MADKEERIYICKTFKTDPCEICEGSGQIECAFCQRKPMFDKSISRSEALERMAKAICRTYGEDCETCRFNGNEKGCKRYLEFRNYIAMAEAALNEVLEETENDRN